MRCVGELLRGFNAYRSQCSNEIGGTSGCSHNVICDVRRQVIYISMVGPEAEAGFEAIRRSEGQ